MCAIDSMPHYEVFAQGDMHGINCHSKNVDRDHRKRTKGRVRQYLDKVKFLKDQGTYHHDCRYPQEPFGEVSRDQPCQSLRRSRFNTKRRGVPGSFHSSSTLLLDFGHIFVFTFEDATSAQAYLPAALDVSRLPPPDLGGFNGQTGIAGRTYRATVSRCRSVAPRETSEVLARRQAGLGARPDRVLNLAT
jgi:hypothetical protein